MTDKSQASSIIGELISREKYRFANADLIAEVVRDTLALYVENEDRYECCLDGGANGLLNFDGLGKQLTDLRGPTDGVGKIDTGRTQ